MRQRALVTGVSRGVGLGVARSLLGQGWHVLGVSRTEPPCTEDVDLRWRWLRYDLSSDVSVDLMATRLRTRLARPLDALVHCALTDGPAGPIGEQSQEAWASAVSTNLAGAYRAVRAALPLLRRAKDPRVLLYAGVDDPHHQRGLLGAAVSQAGLVALTDGLARELAGEGITVNAVLSQPIDWTSFTSPLPAVLSCITHLLSPATQGLTGKTVSAADDWEHIVPLVVPALNDAGDGAWRRGNITMVEALARRIAGGCVV